jgi:hypothetical protein
MRPSFRRVVARVCSERGITGIETGVVVGGLVVASSLFAGVVLNGGIAGSQQLGTAVQAALRQTTTGVELDGPVIVRTDGTRATDVLIDVTTSAGGGSVVLGPTPDDGADAQLAIDYVTDATLQRNVPYTVSWLTGDGDDLLEPGEVAEIDVDVSGVTPPLGGGDAFTLDLRPGDGVAVAVMRTMPAGRPMNAIAMLW